MIFEQEYIIFEILDVLFFDQKNSRTNNSNRNFDAISFRYKADTTLNTYKQQIEVSDDSICYVPSNLSYTRKSKKDKLIVIHFKAFNYHSEMIEWFSPENPEKYRKLFNEMLDCWNKKEVSYKNECSALFSKILSEMYKDNQPAYKNKKIGESIIYMEKNCLRNDFSLAVAAAKSFMSEPYFRRLFKKEFSMSPKQYVIERRMEYAKALIIAGYFSIQEISKLCGYNDQKHFSAEFKKITGVSPSKYGYNFNEN